MGYSVNIIKLLERVDAPMKEVLIEILAEMERQRMQWEESVTKTEFNELKSIVADLAKFQRNTEQRLEFLSQRMEELAEAQRKTEERLESLSQRVEELAEAQRKTEERLNSLAKKVEELTEALKQIQMEMRKLAGDLKKTREDLGYLSHTVGYLLEDRAYEGLPLLLKRDFGIEVHELKRDYVEVAPNTYVELNIIGKGEKEGRRIWIFGECKSQLKKRDVDDFMKNVSKVMGNLSGEKVMVAVTYQTSPIVKKYVEELGLRLYYSYELKTKVF